MFDSHDGFPFVIGGGMTSVTELHPPAVQIFQLWQIYLDNVNPLLKVTHTPTLQGQLIEAAANPSKIPKPLEALLFSIYFMAVISLTDEEALDKLKEEKQRLLSRYHRGTQQALINAGFMKSSDLVVLQAFLMYLVSKNVFSSPCENIGLNLPEHAYLGIVSCHDDSTSEEKACETCQYGT